MRSAADCHPCKTLHGVGRNTQDRQRLIPFGDTTLKADGEVCHLTTLFSKKPGRIGGTVHGTKPGLRVTKWLAADPAGCRHTIHLESPVRKSSSKSRLHCVQLDWIATADCHHHRDQGVRQTPGHICYRCDFFSRSSAIGCDTPPNGPP